MAMTADSPLPPSGEAVIDSPRRKHLPSPWAQVVRGEQESIPPVLHPNLSPSSPQPLNSIPTVEQPPMSDSLSPRRANNTVAESDSGDANANAGKAKAKKQAWSKPSSTVVAEVVSPVMGAISWPALSESTKPSPKSPVAAAAAAAAAVLPDPSSKIVVSDVSSPSSQGHVNPQSPHKQGTTNAKSNASLNQPARQRSMKRGGGSGNGSSSGGVSASGLPQSNFNHPPPTPPPPPPFPLYQITPNSFGNMVAAMPDQSPRDHAYRASNWEPRMPGPFAHQSPGVNDHRHSSRRGNFGSHGDRPHHNNFGSRRDHDRGHHGNNRDVHMQPQRASPRGFRPPPQNNAPFVPPVRSFPNPMGFSDVLYVQALPLEPFRGVPFIAHAPPPPMLMPVPELPLPAKLIHQIEYYFSDANLMKDEYLKSNMDDQGWVPIALIAGFNRVRSMTNDTSFILDSLRASTFLEVQDDKVRRRSDWMKWSPSSNGLPTESRLQSSGDLATPFQKVAIEDAGADKNNATIELHPQPDVTGSSLSELASAKTSQPENTEDAS